MSYSSQRLPDLVKPEDLEDAIYNFIRPHSALKVKLRQPAAHGRCWQQRTPAIAAGLTDRIWSLEELLSYC